MANSSDLDPLALRFQQPDLRGLLQRLVARLRRGQPLSGRLRLSDPSEAQRRAIASLLGSSSSGRSLSIDLEVLATIATSDGRFASLQQLVEAAYGKPIENQNFRRMVERDAWMALWSETLDRCGDSPSLRRWVSDPKTRRWIRRRTGRDRGIAQRLIRDAFAVLDSLPVDPPVTLAQLAADLFGDSHALDADTDRGRLAARGAAAIAFGEHPPAASAYGSRENALSAAQIRAAWSRMGVVSDELSSTVLVLNLPALPGTALGDILSLHAAHGEPCRITFRQLRGIGDCRFACSAHQAVHVCENPSVLAAAADRFGGSCRPLISVEGQPNLAAEALLRALHQQGFTLHYHGDFDWGGIRIAARLWHLFQFVPWRFSAGDYRAAPPGRALKGQPADAPWDPQLRGIMQASGTAVHEEAVMQRLLGDLALTTE